MKKKHRKAIDEILAGFDFQRVHKTMRFLDWRWASVNHGGTPTLFELKTEAERILTITAQVEEDTWFCQTGGFKATKDGNSLTLEFIVSEWDASLK